MKLAVVCLVISICRAKVIWHQGNEEQFWEIERNKVNWKTDIVPGTAPSPRTRFDNQGIKHYTQEGINEDWKEIDPNSPEQQEKYRKAREKNLEEYNSRKLSLKENYELLKSYPVSDSETPP